MSAVLLQNKVTPKDIYRASKDYGDYIKIVVDIEREAIVIGGEWHADGERILIDSGSRQNDIWGGGIDIKTKNIDTTALINLRSKSGNNSQEILNEKVRGAFIRIVKRRFGI